MYKRILLTAAVLMAAAGCNDSSKPRYTAAEMAKIPLQTKTDLPNASGGFALGVGEEAITADEIVLPMWERFKGTAQNNDFETFKEKAGHDVEMVLVTKVSNILLCKKAKKDFGENIDEKLDKAAEAEVRKFVVSFNGDDAKAEQELKRLGMDWKSYKEYQEKMILSQYYVSTKLPDKTYITYSELLDAYNNIKERSFTTPTIIKFRLIDIETAKVELKDPNQDRKLAARELANQVLGQIQGGADFGEMAKKYSNDYRKDYGGEWKRLQPESLAKPYDVLAREAENLEPNRVAGPIDAAGHVFIMKLEEKQQGSVKSLEEVQTQVEATIRAERLKKAIDDLGIKLMQEAALSNKDQFVEFCLEKMYVMGRREMANSL
jgi:peptidyl-prolyl cis-trans isomerase SurA